MIEHSSPSRLIAWVAASRDAARQRARADLLSRCGVRALSIWHKWTVNDLCGFVRAGLAEQAQDWRCSSVHAHLSGRSDGVTTIAPVLDGFPDFAGLIARAPDEEAFARLRRAESIGRPLGDERFVARLGTLTQRPLRPGRRGRKPSRSYAREDDI